MRLDCDSNKNVQIHPRLGVFMLYVQNTKTSPFTKTNI